MSQFSQYEKLALGLAQDHPLFFFYIGGLLVSGVILLGVAGTLLLARPQWRRLHVQPWEVSWYDASMFVWLNIAWIMSVYFLTSLTMGYLPDLSAERVTIFATVFMQTGMIALFFIYRFTQWRLYSTPVNPRRLSLPVAILAGGLLFITIYPVVMLSGSLWQALLVQLKELGWDISLDTQDIVSVFAGEENPKLFAVLLITAVVLAPIAEELLFRATIYRFLKGRVAIWLAMLISSMLFAALHQNLLSFPSLVVLGIMLCLVYEFTGNIRVPIILHAAFNLNSIMLIMLMPQEFQLGLLYSTGWVW